MSSEPTEESEVEEQLSTPSICHFTCSNCNAVISIPEEVLAKRSYSNNCSLCGRPVSIRPVSVESDMEIFELSGCQYAGKQLPKELVMGTGKLEDQSGDWFEISDENEEKTRDVSSSELDGAASSFDDLISKWEVRRKNGDVFQFDSFSLIRTWIQQGKITSGDVIVPTSGDQHVVDTYPGTSDLFGNPTYHTAAKYLSAYGTRQTFARRRKRKIKKILQIMSVLALISLAASYRLVLDQWFIREGKAFVGGLTAGRSLKGPQDPPMLIKEAKRLLRVNSSETLPKAANAFMQALSAAPQNIAALCGLAEAWIETGTLTGDSEEFNRAETLIRYANALNKKSPDVARAQARLYWKRGDLTKARELMEKSTSNDPDSLLLLSRLALAGGDYTKATVSLSDALRGDPNNASLLLAMVELFERQSKFKEAAGYLRQVSDNSANPGQYQVRLRSLYSNAGDFDSLEMVYRKSIAKGGENIEADFLALVKLLDAQNRSREVAQEAGEYLDQFPQGQFVSEIRTISEAALTRGSSGSESPAVESRSVKPKPGTKTRPRRILRRGR